MFTLIKGGSLHDPEKMGVRDILVVEVGKDADLLILDKDLKTESIMAKGQMMIRRREVLVKGTFEV